MWGKYTERGPCLKQQLWWSVGVKVRAEHCPASQQLHTATGWMALHWETGRYQGIGELGAMKTLRILYRDYHVKDIAVYCGHKERKIRKEKRKKVKTQPKLIHSIHIQLCHASKVQDSAIPVYCYTKGKTAWLAQGWAATRAEGEAVIKSQG